MCVGISEKAGALYGKTGEIYEIIWSGGQESWVEGVCGGTGVVWWRRRLEVEVQEASSVNR